MRVSDLNDALASAKERFAERNPLSRAQHETACQAMPGGNTRSVLFHEPFPLAIDHAKDAYLWDCDGHQYIDFLGDFTSGLYGHSNETIVRAIHAALERGLSLSGHNVLEARLASLITSRFPSIDLLRFTNSGTEANLMALAAARIFSGRTKVLVFQGGYHGGLINFTGDTSLNVPVDFVVGTYNDIAGTQALVQKHSSELGAILVEPMLGAGGCIPASAEFLQTLRDEATRIKAVLIFDEVMTSRLSLGGRQLQLGITPDMTALGKYFGGGSSFGAFGGRADIMAMFDPRRPGHLAHSGTFNNNILSMAAGVAGLSKVLSAEVIADLNARGDRLRDRLNELCQSKSAAMQFRGLGSLFAMHPTTREIRSHADLAGVNPVERELFYYVLLERGIYIARRGMFSLMLPITVAHCDRLVEVVCDFLEMSASKNRPNQKVGV